jgi:uncharacterized membrane protein YgdD (TMEM256/DUF423 family)
MVPFSKLCVLAGAVAALLAVALGAFGAHALRQRLPPDLLAVFQTGVQYHFYHALGLIAVGLLAQHLPASSLVRWAGGLILLGIVLFSGSLYALALSGVRALGAVTPIGGVAFIVAWLLVAVAVARA